MAWLQAMLDFEAALARAGARADLVPDDAAEAITAACRAERFDIAALGRDAVGAGNPVVPLIAALRAMLPADVAGYVHWGATSQDVIDTAAMLVARRALAPILEDALTSARACADLAEVHRDTVMLGRTLLQQAVPTTFGLKAAGWLVGICRARRHLVEIAEQHIALQFGGATGTLASLGDAQAPVTAQLAHELELTIPSLPWHTERSRPTLIVGGLAMLSGALAKAGCDVALLSQSEVAEVHEARGAGRGVSSAMPHKRNPVASVAVIAHARRLPGLVATMHAAFVQEHERAAGAWHAEWETFSDVLRLTGSAAAWAADMLEGLEVDPERMRANLRAAGDLVMAESVVAALGAKVDRARAREAVDEAVLASRRDGVSLRAELERNPEVSQALAGDELNAALAPENYLGSAGSFVDRAVGEFRDDLAMRPNSELAGHRRR